MSNPTNEQELREMTKQSVARLIAHRRGEEEQDDKDLITASNILVVCHRLITAHTNAAIARTLDRLEIEMPSKRNTLVGDAYQRTFCNEYNKALKEVSKVIQAERAKLKEVK